MFKRGRENIFGYSFFRLSIIVSANLFLSPAWAETVAVLYSAQGTVQYSSQENPDKWNDVEVGYEFQDSGKVRTLTGSRAGIRFRSGYLVRLGEKAVLDLSKRQANTEGDNLLLEMGKIFVFSREPQRVPNVKTPQLSASVRGTEFVVEVNNDRTVLSVLDGAVFAENTEGSLALQKGEQVIGQPGKVLQKRQIVDVGSAVQWAVSFPRLLGVGDIPQLLRIADIEQTKSLQALERLDLQSARQGFSGVSWVDAVGRALIAEETGQIGLAYREIDSLRGECPSGCLVYKGSLALRLGLIDEADQALQAAREKSMPLDAVDKNILEASGLALHAVNALIGGRRNEAMGLIEQAMEVSDRSVAVLLSASYVSQSRSDWEGAEIALERALELAPERSGVQVRLAEVLFAQGESERSSALLDSLLRRQPDNADAHSLKGFVLLKELDALGAETNFRQASLLDTNAALPRFGLGLALIKQGNLSAGRAALEEAVQLEPTISLHRSYLGKAFFEEEKGKLSALELSRAVELDKDDPTPLLYRSFLHLAEHKPVAALMDLSRSMELNDNRAVYRSRFLLDQDLGARSAGMGRIFSSLGFNELARQYAMESLVKDYGNYSAHFLLGDSYSNTHLTSRARNVENLIGRLLVPVTFNSTSIKTAGDVGLNEYSSLFDRPGDRFMLEAGGDSQTNTVNGGLGFTTTSNNLGITVGYDSTIREGFRDNDFDRFHQSSIQGQYQLDADRLLLWDGAVGSNDKGDTMLQFDPKAEDPDFSQELQSYLVRLGYRQNISQRSFLLAHVFLNGGKLEVDDLNRAGRLRFLDVYENGSPISLEPYFLDTLTAEDYKTKTLLSRADVQLINEDTLVSLIMGVSGRVESTAGDERGRVTDPGSATSLSFIRDREFSSDADSTEHSAHVFAYGTWHLLPELDLTTGLTFQNVALNQNAANIPFVDDNSSRQALDPKVGVIYKPFATTSLRASYSQALDFTARGGIGQLEPTFVGGFNQLYDGLAGQDQELYAFGVDQQFARTSYLGGSYQVRNLKLAVPAYDGGLTFDRDTRTVSERLFLNTDEGQARIDRYDAYYYQIFGESMAFALSYAYEYFDDSDPLPDTKTVRVAPALRYFHSSGAYAALTPAWRYQERGGEITPKVSDDFFVWNLGLGYEFDSRHGRAFLDFRNILDEDFSYSAITDEAALLPRFGAVLGLNLNF